MLTVEKINDTTFKVTVSGNKVTTHQVNLASTYYQKLTGGKVSPAQLIEKSFTFLLERESNTSILSSFNLSVISHYFPEYETTIQEMCKL